MAKQSTAGKGSAKAASGNNVSGFTDTKRVRELVQLMAENDLTEIELVEDKSKITLRRGGVHMAAAPAAAVMHAAPAAVHAMPSAPPATPAVPAADAADADLVPIKSPMVGTYYSAASPDAEPYAGVGSTVGPETVVCIIEAMKVFNEIRAETSGTIAKVLIANGQTVEYGQPLFMVRPA